MTKLISENLQSGLVVQGLSPMGKIHAGKMEIKRKTPQAPIQVWFSDRVLVDYLPEKI